MTRSLHQLMIVAAELRAAGFAWKAVAERVQRKSSTVQQWPSRFPQVWNEVYRDAQLRRFDEMCNEALNRQRELLHSEDDRVALKAVEIWLKSGAVAFGRNGTMVLHEPAPVERTRDPVRPVPVPQENPGAATVPDPIRVPFQPRIGPVAWAAVFLIGLFAGIALIPPAKRSPPELVADSGRMMRPPTHEPGLAVSDAAVADRLIESVERPDCPPNLPYSGRLGIRPQNLIRSRVGGPVGRRLARATLLLPRIRHFEQEFGRLSNVDLKARANQLRGRSRAGDKSSEFFCEGFGLCSVAVWRTLGMRAFDVQLAAGVVMFEGALCELATGEGKTLTATFPVFLRALAAKGVHVATVNDYLAKRDAELMAPVYRMLGLSVGFLQQKMEDADRQEAYRLDVTYGTASEFGFDFLRDRLKRSGGQVASTPFWGPWTAKAGARSADPRVQRGHYFALVDEADSIFIDEARTPLIISAPTREAKPEECVMYYWADTLAKTMRHGEHFKLDIKKDKIEVTDSGRQLARYSSPPSGPHAPAMDKLIEAIEKALQANHRFVLDHHYMIHESKVVIVDESTGRPMPDRHWREGLHQAVEAKEKVPVHVAADHAASITYQSYFRQYEKLAGMTGTIVQNSKEIRRVYKLRVVQIPTNMPIVRKRLPDLVYPTEDAKFDAVVAEIKRLRDAGRPVLIGTRTVEKSEALSSRLTALGVPHRVLNAKQDKEEALIVSQAGQAATVTVATNMAGRGTDIKLGSGVADIGGLHVIGTERHEAIRIDRQLLGRAGRQGDPGSGQLYLSLEDKLLEALTHERHEKLIRIGKAGGRRDWNLYRRLFVISQKKTEAKHYRQRLDLMHYERQRKELLGDLGADPFVD